MNAGQRLPEPIVSAAIGWQMRLRTHAGNDEVRGQLQDWLDRDARHQLAWTRLQQMDRMFHAGALPGATHTIPMLQRAEAELSRRRALKLLGVGVTLGGAGWLSTKAMPNWRADYATTTGERRRVALGATGSVWLNTNSALDHSGGEWVLRSGEALVSGDGWRLRCRFAVCEGHDASVLLRDHDDYSEIRVQAGEVQVTTRAGTTRLSVGESASVSARGVDALARGPIDPFAWSRGLLIVSDIRLADFLAEAGRYRSGWLGCDPKVADLRLSGVFQLDDPVAMLGNIVHLLPVEIIERTRWWVRVVPVA
ncbi:DUF4880 domain-containing protein [Pseudomonas matsuisoli]|uniref:Anti-sigma factor FoxR n=1 Tax=Pseudomonas matsuisoli TaxID=1515666 RepID=A0A917PVF8_9PSED|nr:DUF4880 domain-containing protein [Pseudomonas matsuisoli]GGJ94649.1 anti-sigma factor FoxR [Pseudomonas matsuisoli]